MLTVPQTRTRARRRLLMAKTALYRMPHRRRREQKTDYRIRLRLVRGGETRAVIRKSTSHITVQFVNWEMQGDKTLLTVSSSHLAKFGWGAGMGNVPAAYLTGLLAAKLASTMGIKEVIVDLGMQTNTNGSRLYAAVKGMVDGGLCIPHDSAKLPSEDRISGKHIAAWAANAQGAFGSYKVRAAELPKHFAEVKARIVAGNSTGGGAAKGRST